MFNCIRVINIVQGTPKRYMTILTKFDNFISLLSYAISYYISYLEFFRALFFLPPPVSDFFVFAPTTLSLATLVLRTRLLLLLLERPLDDVTATGSSITGITATAALTCVFVGNVGFAMAGTTAGTAIAVETAAVETTALAVALTDALVALLFIVLDMEEVEEDEDDKLAGDSFGIIRFCEGSERTDEREKIRSSGVLLYLLAFEATKSEALRSM